MRKILYIHPVAEPHMKEPIKKYLCDFQQKDCKVDVTCLEGSVTNLEFYSYQLIVGEGILRKVQEAENMGYQAAIIGCFDDPALDAAKEIVTGMPLIGIAQASMMLASALGESFSVVSVNRKCTPPFRRLAFRYGMKEKIKSFRELNLTVNELQNNKDLTAYQIERCVKKAVEEDRAEIIVLGCSMMFGFFREMQKKYGVPVIDPMIAGLKYAEFLADVHQKTGWTISKAGSYMRPEEVEMRKFGIY